VLSPKLNEPDEKLLRKVFEAFSNPLDMRTDNQLAADLGVEPVELTRVRSDPAFMQQVTRTFDRLLVGVKPEIMKCLLRSVQAGGKDSSANAKILLQALGVLDTGKVVVNVNGGEGFADPFAKMSSYEIDAEIQRLVVETVPSDIMFSGGQVVPYEEVETA
jgi:hypothetical protein